MQRQADHKMLLRAFNLANMAHEGQWRDDPHERGVFTEPYIFHPVRVASAVEGFVPKIAAVLHDVVEDTDVPLSDLAPMFGSLIAETVDALTKRKPAGETKEQYWVRVAAHPVGAYVKLADILDNIRDQPEGGSMRRRYLKATGAVLAAGASLGTPTEPTPALLNGPLKARALEYIAAYER